MIRMTQEEFFETRGYTVANVHKWWAMVHQAAPAVVVRWRQRARGRKLFGANERLYGWPLDPGPIGPITIAEWYPPGGRP